MTRLVTSADGVQLAVYERGRADGPTIVAVHGYPDDHTVWDGLTGALADEFRIVSYDVRGAGESDAPGSVAQYRMRHLVNDLYAVLDAVSPDAPVHLVAHDWGSIQGWAALTDPRCAGRIASYTSISGPSATYGGVWLRDFRAHPRGSVVQAAHSYYLVLFQLPALPEFAIRHGLLDRFVRGSTSRTDQLRGLALYRANLRGRVGRPLPVPSTVPVLVIAPEQDPFVTVEFASESPRPWVVDLTVHTIPGEHWVIRTRPDQIARLTREFVTAAT